MIAILVAAGSSRRMGFDKLTADLAGKPVAAYSLLAFEQCPSVRRIIVVTREDRLTEFEEMGKAFQISKLRKVVPGGTERHLSVWSGIQAGNPEKDDYVAVHDVARPLITPAAIEACLTRQPGVRALVENGWVHLFAMDATGQRFWRYTKNQFVAESAEPRPGSKPANQ